MSFAKPISQKSFDQDESARLMCSVPGCGKPWSIKIDAPMCSYHQWQKTAPREKTHISTILPAKPKTVKQWYDDKEDF